MKLKHSDPAAAKRCVEVGAREAIDRISCDDFVRRRRRTSRTVDTRLWQF